MGRLPLLALTAGLSVAVWVQPAWAQPEEGEVDEAPTSAPAAAPTSAARVPTAPGLTKPKSERVKLSFRSSPAGASVYFGRRLLGTTPFELDWKRDSGPVDVAVRMGGFFTVNTRIYTLRDDTLSVKMTRLSDGHTLYGYKAPLKGAAPPPARDEDAP